MPYQSKIHDKQFKRPLSNSYVIARYLILQKCAKNSILMKNSSSNKGSMCNRKNIPL